MIYTVTLNPGIDYVAEAYTSVPGKTNRTHDEYIVPGGKSLNVSVMLSRLGAETAALSFVSGFTGRELIRMMEKEHVRCDFIDVGEGFTRINVKIMDNGMTEFNGAGISLKEAHIEALTEKIRKIRPDDLLVLSGSIPKGAGKDLYARLLSAAAPGVRTVLDTSGEALTAALPCRPFLIKPNRDELSEAAGKELDSAEEILQAAKILQDRGAKNVLVSMGEDGAMLLTESGEVYVEPAIPVEALAPIGAGDSMIAGFLYRYLETGDMKDALLFGIAAGSATASSPWLAEGARVKEMYRKAREERREGAKEMKETEENRKHPAEALIDGWIEAHKEEMIRDLMEFVRIPSVSRADLAAPGMPYGPDVRKMLDYALEKAGSYGFRTEDHDGLSGSAYYGDADGELGIVAHLDVVPEGEGWVYAPYEPVLQDGFMIGRGCSDNKASAVSGLYIMRFLKENGIRLKKTFRLMMGCAEETGMDDFRTYFERGGKAPDLTIVADGAFPLCYAQKGGWNATAEVPAGADLLDFTAGNVRNAIPDKAVLLMKGVPAEELRAALSGRPIDVEETDGAVRLTAHGKGGHAASPENTENAIVVLASACAETKITEKADLRPLPLISRVFRTPYGDGMGFACEDEMTGKLTSNIGVVRLENGSVRMELDCRFPASADMGPKTDAFRAMLREAGGDLTMVDIAAPFYMDPASEEAQTLMAIYREQTGDETPAYTMGGGTYSRVIPNGVTFGPGMMRNGRRPDFLPAGHGGAHGPDETLNLENWLKAFKIYLVSFLRLGM